jgi:protein phosphatase PTC7
MTRYRARISLKRSSRSYATNAPTIARPFTFHIGASFVGKPAHPDDKPIKNPGFPEGALKKWRDETLAWPKGLQTAHPGHDFFYVQEARHPISVGAMHRF